MPSSSIPTIGMRGIPPSATSYWVREIRSAPGMTKRSVPNSEQPCPASFSRSHSITCQFSRRSGANESVETSATHARNDLTRHQSTRSHSICSWFFLVITESSSCFRFTPLAVFFLAVGTVRIQLRSMHTPFFINNTQPNPRSSDVECPTSSLDLDSFHRNLGRLAHMFKDLHLFAYEFWVTSQ